MKVLLVLANVFTAVSYCENDCSGHGTCNTFDVCSCFAGINGIPAWTGNDCGQRTCPRYNFCFIRMQEFSYFFKSSISWVGEIKSANNLHPMAECSNRGTCDRRTGLCNCLPNYDGLACERTACPNDCSGNGVCYTEKQLADEAGRLYSIPWDANKAMGCVCDTGRRGPDCSLRKINLSPFPWPRIYFIFSVDCPSGRDILGGPGNESGRECSGRGICDYNTGICRCFNGYFGSSCRNQVTWTSNDWDFLFFMYFLSCLPVFAYSSNWIVYSKWKLQTLLI